MSPSELKARRRQGRRPHDPESLAGTGNVAVGDEPGVDDACTVSVSAAGRVQGRCGSHGRMRRQKGVRRGATGEGWRERVRAFDRVHALGSCVCVRMDLGGRGALAPGHRAPDPRPATTRRHRRRPVFPHVRARDRQRGRHGHVRAHVPERV
jgi:hypothetical protein